MRPPVISVAQILVVMMGIVDLMIAMVMKMVVLMKRFGLMKMVMEMSKPKEILPGITMQTSGLG